MALGGTVSVTPLASWLNTTVLISPGVSLRSLET